jgi:hypothetical protein
VTSFRRIGASTFAVVCLLWASGASAKSIIEMRIASAKTPGKCPNFYSTCTLYGKVGIAMDDCTPRKWPNGQDLCGSFAGYYCAVGFLPLYRSQVGHFYTLQSDSAANDEKLTFFTVSTPEACRPPRSDACFAGLDYAARTNLTKGWYCKMLNLVQSFFQDGEDLIRRLRDNAGLIARFNSTFGGSPSLSSLQSKFKEHARALAAELADFHHDELTGRRIGSGYYENRLRVLKEMQDIHDALNGKVYRAGMDIVRTAERGEVIAKKVQKVLIKVAGYAVFAFTGGNRIAQCLTEAGIESAANAVTQKLKGNELTLSGVGKDSLRTLIFRCADALTGGPAADILGMLTGGLQSLLEEFEQKIKDKMRGFWKKIASKVKWVVDKLSFLMDDAVVQVFSHAAEEVAVEFGVEAFPACMKPLFKRQWQDLFRCLGTAARKALGVGVPRGLFDSAMQYIEDKLPEAKKWLHKLASFAGLQDDPTVRTLLTGLQVAAKAAIAKAKKCRDQIQGFSSIRPVFSCVASAFGTVQVKTLGSLAIWEVLQEALSKGENRVIAALNERRYELTEGLKALGVPLPQTVLSILRTAVGEAARTFAKSARSCLPKAGSSTGLVAGIRATVTCLGQAARSALGATGHVLVQGALAEIAKAAQKGVASLQSAISDAVESVRAAVDDIALVPAPVQEAVRRAKASAQDKNAKAFARAIQKSCVRPAGKSESLRDYIRASARCLADAATTHLKAAGAAVLTKLLSDVRRWVEKLGKETGDVAAAFVGKVKSIADTLGVVFPELPKKAEVAAELAADTKKFTRRAGECVGGLSVAANTAAKSHEKMSSMARELRAAMRIFGRCLQSAVAKKSAAKKVEVKARKPESKAKKPAAKAKKPSASKKPAKQ